MMASSYVDPSARQRESRSQGAYSGWVGQKGVPSIERSRSGMESRREEDGESEDNARRTASGQEQQEYFVPNEELGEPGSKMVCAPADADVVDLSKGGGGPCFACNFVKKKDNADDPFNDGEIRDAYADMIRLQQDNYGKMSMPSLVNLIYDFYEREIRPMGYEEWTKTSISRHILFHQNDEDVMMQETTDMLYAQMQSLRSKTWCENTVDASVEPHHKNIATILNVVRALDDHLTKKKNRIK